MFSRLLCPPIGHRASLPAIRKLPAASHCCISAQHATTRPYLPCQRVPRRPGRSRCTRPQTPSAMSSLSNENSRNGPANASRPFRAILTGRAASASCVGRCTGRSGHNDQLGHTQNHGTSSNRAADLARATTGGAESSSTFGNGSPPNGLGWRPASRCDRRVSRRRRGRVRLLRAPVQAERWERSSALVPISGGKGNLPRTERDPRVRSTGPGRWRSPPHRRLFTAAATTTAGGGRCWSSAHHPRGPSSCHSRPRRGPSACGARSAGTTPSLPAW